MKILLIHYRYSIIGGPERYLFNVKMALEDKGHEVIPFSIAYPNNEKDKYDKYFVHPIQNQFYLHKISPFSLSSLKVAKNMLYNKTAAKSLDLLVKKIQPDIAYVLLYRGKLSHSIFDALYRNNIPTIMRISSFSYFCGKATFFRDGKVCEECITKPKSIIKHRCIHNSLLYSTLSYLINKKERKSNTASKVKEVICPSTFTASFFQKDPQFKNVKITHLPTFFDLQNFTLSGKKIAKRFNGKIILYVGRISEEKGVDVLIDALAKLKSNSINFKAIITGFGDNEFSNNILSKIDDFQLNKNIECKGFITKSEVYELIDNSFVSIVPSIWYENMPNSLIESQAYGLPVIASNIGSLKELIKLKYNGWLFVPSNPIDLADKIDIATKLSFDEYTKLSFQSKKWAENYCSKDKHIETLISIFNKYI